MHTVNHSYRDLRKAVGFLGIALPILLIISDFNNIRASISSYYYSNMSAVFTGILITFGLILFTYRGTDNTESRINENLLTNLGGVFALLVALVPTKYGGSIETTVYAHSDGLRGWIHNGSAVLFIFSMGLVVLLRFSKAPYFRKTYKTLGWLVMVGLAFTIFAFAYKAQTGEQLFNGAIFYGESFSIWMFAIAWIRRGVPIGEVDKKG